MCNESYFNKTKRGAVHYCATEAFAYSINSLSRIHRNIPKINKPAMLRDEK